MLSIDRCRQILGTAARNMSDDQIEQLRDQLYRFADVVVTVARERRHEQPANDSTESL
jgi:hypothetical protein